MSDTYPKRAPDPAEEDEVQILMTREMSRRFEESCLGKGNTVGNTYLAGPLLFSEDDIPSYIIGIREDRPRYRTLCNDVNCMNTSPHIQGRGCI